MSESNALAIVPVERSLEAPTRPGFDVQPLRNGAERRLTYHLRHGMASIT